MCQDFRYCLFHEHVYCSTAILIQLSNETNQYTVCIELYKKKIGGRESKNYNLIVIDCFELFPTGVLSPQISHHSVHFVHVQYRRAIYLFTHRCQDIVICPLNRFYICGILTICVTIYRTHIVDVKFGQKVLWPFQKLFIKEMNSSGVINKIVYGWLWKRLLQAKMNI